MDTAHRRIEIVSELAARRHMTAGELARQFHVSIRTIHNDIQALSFDYPVYTKVGENGGIFMAEGYKPFANTLSHDELDLLCEIYGKIEGERKKLLYRIIRRYGPDKLKI
jgi:predicted DNA-binding transcriptional regulator YafY